MATSSKQTVATVPVYDYVLAAGDPTAVNPTGVKGRKVKVTLAYDRQRSSAPSTWLLETPTYSALTDANGFWQVNVVPTDQMAVANSYYIVEIEGYASYKINPIAAGVPAAGWQSSAILLDTPISLTAAGQTVTGPLTVNGLLTTTGGEVISGGTGATLNAAGDLAVRSVTASSGSGPYSSVLPGDATTATPAGVATGKVWDWGGTAYNYKAGGCKLDGVTDDTVKAQAVHAAVIAAGGGVIDHPGGVLRITAALTAAMNTGGVGITWRSAGRGVSQISQVSGNTDCLVLGATGAEKGDFMRISGLTLKCPAGAGQTGKCLRMNNCLHAVVESLDVVNGGWGIYWEGQNENHHVRDISYSGHAVSAFSGGNVNGGAGAVLDAPEMQKHQFEHWRIGGGTSPTGPAIDINAGIINAVQQVSGLFTLDHVIIDGGWNNHQIRLTQTSLAWHISNVANEVPSGLTDATYDGIRVEATSGNGTIQDCQMVSRDDGTVNRFNTVYNILAGPVLLERCAISGLGPALNDYSFTGNGGGTVLDCGLSSAALFNVSGSAVGQVLVLGLRRSNGAPFRPLTDAQINPYNNGLDVGGELRHIYNNEANTRWLLTRNGGVGLAGSALLFGPGGATALDTGIGRVTTAGWGYKQGSMSRSYSIPAFVTPWAPDMTVADSFEMTITAALTINAPNISNVAGMLLTITLIQGGAGAFGVTLNAVFKGIAFNNTGNVAGARSTMTFQNDGTNWNLLGAQTAWA